jgi:hypothetical protein
MLKTCQHVQQWEAAFLMGSLQAHALRMPLLGLLNCLMVLYVLSTVPGTVPCHQHTAASSMLLAADLQMHVLPFLFTRAQHRRCGPGCRVVHTACLLWSIQGPHWSTCSAAVWPGWVLYRAGSTTCMCASMHAGFIHAWLGTGDMVCCCLLWYMGHGLP